MRIETWCDHCKQAISTIGIVNGKTHDNTFIHIELKDADTKCKGCRFNTVSLRLIGRTVNLGQEQEHT